VHQHLLPVEFAFPGPLRDRLLAAIRSGAKVATSSLLREYEMTGEDLPRVGERGAVLDSMGSPAFVIETIGVDVVRLQDVSDAHAHDEGEGYASAAEWREGHERFWRSPEMQEELGPGFSLDDGTLVILERFRVVDEGP